MTVVVRIPEDQSAERRRLDIAPATPLLPFAVMLWGAKAECYLRGFTVDGEEQLLNTVPGALFESELSFEEFERSLSKGGGPGLDPYPELDGTGLTQLGLIFRLDLPATGPGGRISLDLEGAFEHGVLLCRALTAFELQERKHPPGIVDSDDDELEGVVV